MAILTNTFRPTSVYKNLEQILAQYYFYNINEILVPIVTANILRLVQGQNRYSDTWYLFKTFLKEIHKDNTLYLAVKNVLKYIIMCLLWVQVLFTKLYHSFIQWRLDFYTYLHLKHFYSFTKKYTILKILYSFS